MKKVYLSFLIITSTFVFSQDIPINDTNIQKTIKPEIGYIELFAGSAFGYIDGFAAGANISFLYQNVLFSLAFISDNKKAGLEYVDNSSLIPLNYYKHYRIDNIPLMIGMYHSFKGASLSASAGLSICNYREYIDLNTFSIFNSNATELYFNTAIGFPYEFNLKLFNKREDALMGYGLKLFGNLGKYNFTGLAFVVSIGEYK
jgi:hypothetical protein